MGTKSKRPLGVIPQDSAEEEWTREVPKIPDWYWWRDWWNGAYGPLMAIRIYPGEPHGQGKDSVWVSDNSARDRGIWWPIPIGKPPKEPEGNQIQKAPVGDKQPKKG